MKIQKLWKQVNSSAIQANKKGKPKKPKLQPNECIEQKQAPKMGLRFPQLVQRKFKHEDTNPKGRKIKRLGVGRSLNPLLDFAFYHCI